jgi:hypothetical protein
MTCSANAHPLGNAFLRAGGFALQRPVPALLRSADWTFVLVIVRIIVIVR